MSECRGAWIDSAAGNLLQEEYKEQGEQIQLVKYKQQMKQYKFL